MFPRQSLGAARDGGPESWQGPGPGGILLISLSWSGFGEKGKRRVWGGAAGSSPQETRPNGWGATQKERDQAATPEPPGTNSSEHWWGAELTKAKWFFTYLSLLVFLFLPRIAQRPGVTLRGQAKETFQLLRLRCFWFICGRHNKSLEDAFKVARKEFITVCKFENEWK